MRLQIKLVDPSMPPPEYKSSGAVAFDLYSRLNLTIGPGQINIVPTNVIVRVPENYMLLVASRSSTPLRTGLVLANGVGIIDQDYCGDEDEIGLQFWNTSNKKVKIAKGERVGQAVLVRIARVTKFTTMKKRAKGRGGWGSTGY
jgi:dUTP pyrophosphatase